jgi:bacterioferritin-associated ferredoxin
VSPHEPPKDASRHFDIANASQQRYLESMLVCICNAITEADLRQVAEHGVTCPVEAYAILGKAPNCGICLDHAEDVMADAQKGCTRRCPGRGAGTAGGLSLST